MDTKGPVGCVWFLIFKYSNNAMIVFTIPAGLSHVHTAGHVRVRVTRRMPVLLSDILNYVSGLMDTVSDVHIWTNVQAQRGGSMII